MPPDEITAIREDERVTRLFPARPRERGEVRPDGRFPGNDVARGVTNHLISADLRTRLDDALEQQLREPFAHIRTVAAVLKDESTAQRSEQLEEIGKATDRGEAMLQDVLEFMRIAAGGLSISRRRVDLKVVCERVVDAVHIANPDRAMMFTSDSRVEGLWDPDRMAMLVSKLLMNAIEHGITWPAVRVELQGSEEEAVLAVWNSGALMPPEPPRKLFEPFARGNLRTKAACHGLGLGLFLAREIASRHGGRIDVQSSEDAGTTFRVTLPRR